MSRSRMFVRSIPEVDPKWLERWEMAAGVKVNPAVAEGAMSEQATAEAQAIHVQFDRNGHDRWTRDWATSCPVCASIALALDRREREALERAAKATCDLCAKGWPTFVDETRKFLAGDGSRVPMIAHVTPERMQPSLGPDHQCDASAIRALVGSVDRAEAESK